MALTASKDSPRARLIQPWNTPGSLRGDTRLSRRLLVLVGCHPVLARPGCDGQQHGEEFGPAVKWERGPVTGKYSSLNVLRGNLECQRELHSDWVIHPVIVS